MRIKPPIAIEHPLLPEPNIIAFDESDFATIPKPFSEIIRIDTTEQIETLVSQLIKTSNLFCQLNGAALDLNDVLCGLRSCYGLPNNALDRWSEIRDRISEINSRLPGLYDWACKTKKGESK